MTRAQLRAALLAAPIGEPIALQLPTAVPPCFSVLATRWEDGWSVVRLHGGRRLPSAPDVHGGLDRVAPVISVWLGLPIEPPLSERVVALHANGLTNAEIASAVGIPEGSVRMYLHRAKLKANPARVLRVTLPAEVMTRVEAAAGEEGVEAWVAKVVRSALSAEVRIHPKDMGDALARWHEAMQVGQLRVEPDPASVAVARAEVWERAANIVAGLKSQAPPPMTAHLKDWGDGMRRGAIMALGYIESAARTDLHGAAPNLHALEVEDAGKEYRDSMRCSGGEA